MIVDKKIRALENFSDNLPKPGNILLMEAITSSCADLGAFDPASLAKHFGMLGDGCLGNGQVVNDVCRNAAGVGNKELHHLKTDWIAERLEHGYQFLLFSSGNVECAASFRQ